jgi:hypothetical protein
MLDCCIASIVRSRSVGVTRKRTIWKRKGTMTMARKKDKNNPTVELLRDVIKARLKELGRNAFQAERIGGLGRTFIYGFLTGQKQSLGGVDSMERVAKGLEWSLDKLNAEINPSGVKAITSPKEENETTKNTGARSDGEFPLPELVVTHSLCSSASVEAAFIGVVQILRPDLSGETPALLELFRTRQREQILAQRFTPKQP